MTEYIPGERDIVSWSAFSFEDALSHSLSFVYVFLNRLTSADGYTHFFYSDTTATAFYTKEIVRRI